MELGGNVEQFIGEDAFDSFSIMSTKELLSWQALGLKDGRPASCAWAGKLAGYANDVRATVAGVDGAGLSGKGAKRWKELRSAMLMLGHLADYYSGRLESAYWRGLSDQGADENAPAAAALQRSLAAWTQMSDSPEANYYKPFVERLRMHTNQFHWRNELPALKAIVEADAAAPGGSSTITASVPSLPPPVPSSAVLTWAARGQDIVCRIPAEGLTAAWLLAKPLPSTTLFHKTPMERKGRFFEARFQRLNCGHAVAADVEFDGHVARTPFWENAAPYLIIPSLPKPTPTYYGSAEAMTYLKPQVLTPEKFGTLLLPPRSDHFFNDTPLGIQRKLLEPVSRGMRLVILQEIFGTKDYSLKWLPAPPRTEMRAGDEFDPGGALGLPAVKAPGILSQIFLADARLGDFRQWRGGALQTRPGRIWIIQARAMQMAHRPDAARLLARVLSLDPAKPVVLLTIAGNGPLTPPPIIRS